MTTLFISDLHLAPERPAINEIFLRFLRGPALEARALYILGDLFEYWAGDDDLDDPFNRQVAEALREASSAGLSTFFLHGNRDFLIGEAFARAAGLSLLADPTLAEIEGVPTLLLHGDTLCTDDIAYQRFRAQVRDPAWIAAMLARPLAERKAIAEDIRRKSEAAKQAKAMDIMDVNAGAVAQALRGHGYVRMIHGHTHRPARHELVVDGHQCLRWVLPDWYERGGGLRCVGTRCEAFTLE